MDFQFTENQARFQAIAREFAKDVLRKNWSLWDERHEFPLEALRGLAERRLMGVNIPEDRGGAGAGVVAYSAAVQEIAWGDPAVAVTMCVNNMVAEVIEEFGNARHKEFVPRLMSGEANSGSFCLSEAGSGSDAAAMQTNARRTSNGYILNGTKAWITSGEHAGALLVWSRVDSGAKDSITVFFVDAKSPGISFGAPEEKMGQHASNTVVVAFDDVEIPKDAVLGEVGQGFKVAMMALDGGRIGIASQALGIADAMLDEASRRLEISVELLARVEAARLLVFRAAVLKENRSPFTMEASLAKLAATEVACEIGDTLGKKLGPLGQYDLFAKLIRDARVTRIYEGTSEVQRIVIARELEKRGA